MDIVRLRAVWTLVVETTMTERDALQDRSDARGQGEAVKTYTSRDIRIIVAPLGYVEIFLGGDSDEAEACLSLNWQDLATVEKLRRAFDTLNSVALPDPQEK